MVEFVYPTQNAGKLLSLTGLMLNRMRKNLPSDTDICSTVILNVNNLGSHNLLTNFCSRTDYDNIDPNGCWL